MSTLGQVGQLREAVEGIKGGAGGGGGGGVGLGHVEVCVGQDIEEQEQAAGEEEKDHLSAAEHFHQNLALNISSPAACFSLSILVFQFLVCCMQLAPANCC